MSSFCQLVPIIFNNKVYVLDNGVFYHCNTPYPLMVTYNHRFADILYFDVYCIDTIYDCIYDCESHEIFIDEPKKCNGIQRYEFAEIDDKPHILATDCDNIQYFYPFFVKQSPHFRTTNAETTSYYALNNFLRVYPGLGLIKYLDRTITPTEIYCHHPLMYRCGNKIHFRPHEFISDVEYQYDVDDFEFPQA